MSAPIARAGRILFGAAVASALGFGLSAATASAAPTAPAGRHCWTYTHTAQLCRQHCAQTTATSYDWDPATGCCTCIF